MHSEPYQDRPPTRVYFALLALSTYLCSIITMHRLLRSRQEHGERRRQRPTQHHTIPCLMACQPNQV